MSFGAVAHAAAFMIVILSNVVLASVSRPLVEYVGFLFLDFPGNADSVPVLPSVPVLYLAVSARPSHGMCLTAIPPRRVPVRHAGTGIPAARTLTSAPDRSANSLAEALVGVFIDAVGMAGARAALRIDLEEPIICE